MLNPEKIQSNYDKYIKQQKAQTSKHEKRQNEAINRRNKLAADLANVSTEALNYHRQSLVKAHNEISNDQMVYSGGAFAIVFFGILTLGISFGETPSMAQFCGIIVIAWLASFAMWVFTGSRLKKIETELEDILYILFQRTVSQTEQES